MSVPPACPRPIQHGIEAGPVEKAAVDDHRVDAPGVLDVLQRVGVEHHEIGQLALYDSAQLLQAAQIASRMEGIRTRRSTATSLALEVRRRSLSVSQPIRIVVRANDR